AQGTGPLHVGILSENRPEFVFALFGCALAGGTLVALNPTRSGEALARDVEHTDCRILLADEALLDRVIAIRPRLRAFDDGRVLVLEILEARRPCPREHLRSPKDSARCARRTAKRPTSWFAPKTPSSSSSPRARRATPRRSSTATV